MRHMNTQDIHKHFAPEGFNLTEFSQRHRLPLRTLQRIKAGGTPSAGNALLIGNAISKDLKKAAKEKKS